MTTIPIRFLNGQGLELSPNTLSQRGLSKLDHAELELREVVRKRTGHLGIAPTRSADAADVIPADEARAVWARNSEALLETENRLYALQRCAGQDPGAIPIGTATALEISDATDELVDRSATQHDFDFVLPGDIRASDARTRLARVDVPVSVLQTTAIPLRSVLVTVTESAPGRFQWEATEVGKTSGPFDLPSASGSSIQRLPRIELTPLGSRDIIITYLDQAQLRSIGLVLEPGNPGSEPPTYAVTNFGVLATMAGSPNGARYEARNQVAAGVLSNGSIRVWDMKALPGTHQTFTMGISTPTTTDAIYDFDVRAPFGYSGASIAVAWHQQPTGFPLSMALLETAGPSITAEFEAAILPSSVDRVGLDFSPTGDLNRYVCAYRAGTEEPVVEFGPVDPIIRLVDHPGTVTLTTIRTETAVTTNWTASGAFLTLAMPTAAIDTPTDLAAHRDALGVYQAIIDASGLSEQRIDRDLGPPPVVSVAAGIEAVAIADSANRLIIGYRDTPVEYAVRVYVSTQDLTANAVALPIAIDLEIAGPMAMAVLAESGGDDAVVRLHALLDAALFAVYSATLDTAAGTVIEVTTNTLGGLPTIFSAFATGAAPRTLLGAVVAGNQVWEADPPLWVKVAPVGVALAGGNWVDRGPWSRLNHRSVTARRSIATSVLQCDAVTVRSAQGVRCTLAATEEASIQLGFSIDVISTHVEASEIINVAGKNPRTASYDATRGAIGYIDTAGGNSVELSLWTPGLPLSFAPTGIICDTLIWDIKAVTTATGLPVLVLAVMETITTMRLQVRADGETPVLTTFVLPAEARDIAVHAQPDENDDIVISVAAALITPEVWVTQFTGDATTGPFAAPWTTTWDPGEAPHAVSTFVLPDLSAHDVWIEVSRTSGPVITRDVQFEVVNSLGHTPIRRSIERAAIMCQQEQVLGQHVGGLELVANDFDNRTLHSGVFLFNPRTSEIVGRTSLGVTSIVDSPSTRDVRYPHGSLTIDGEGGLTMGAELRELTSLLRQHVVAQVLQWPKGENPHRPAVLDKTAVGAHGGYPRVYTGDIQSPKIFEGMLPIHPGKSGVHEHDWHDLPTMRTPQVFAATGALSAGTYTAAVVWEHINAQGDLARSAPTLSPPIVVIANDSIVLPIPRLDMTERRGVKVVAYRSTADGSGDLLYRENDIFEATQQSNNVILLKSDAELLATGTLLDQGPGGVLSSEPVGATDFMSAANGRFWTMDPERPANARYSIQQREGFMLHWSAAAVVENPREEDLTTIAELAGRVTLMTRQGVSYMHGDGPDNAGVGTYAVPIAQVLEVGATSHATTAITPDGLFYFTGRGLRLLTSSLQTIDIGDAVSARYERDGFLARAMSYRPEGAEVTILDQDAVGLRSRLRYHHTTRRWAEDPTPAARDVAYLDTGNSLLLGTDATVHLSADVRTDNDEGYRLVIETAWLPVLGGLGGGPQQRAHNFYEIRGWGSYDGPHLIRVSVFHDYSDTPTIIALRTAAENADNDAAGLPYIWHVQVPGRLAFATLIRVEDGAEPNETFTLEGIDIRIGGTGDSDFAGLPSALILQRDGSQAP